MQPYRITTRSIPVANACRRACAAPSSSRTMFTTPFFPSMGAGGSFYNPAAELGPLFRLLDSATADLLPSTPQQHKRSFTPRFDVREVDNSYELKGEVPGLRQGDLDIEFVDERTLVIKGRHERESETSKQQQDENVDKAVAANDAQDTQTSDNASEKSGSSNYHKASVEDEYVDAGVEANEKAPATEKDNTVAAAPAAPAPAESSAKPAEPAFKYWVSERSVGEFERRFAFPGRVDQDAVTASLRDGILSVVVPKIVGREAKRIAVQ